LIIKAKSTIIIITLYSIQKEYNSVRFFKAGEGVSKAEEIQRNKRVCLWGFYTNWYRYWLCYEFDSSWCSYWNRRCFANSSFTSLQVDRLIINGLQVQSLSFNHRDLVSKQVAVAGFEPATCYFHQSQGFSIKNKWQWLDLNQRRVIFNQISGQCLTYTTSYLSNMIDFFSDE